MDKLEKLKKKSRAKRTKILLKKYKGLIKAHYETANFKEPILFLRRRNGRIEFHEDASKGHFEFTHSDGETRYLNLNGDPDIFEYGNKTFRGYIYSEDDPFKFPQEPLITAEMYTIAMEKTNNDLRKWKTEQTKANTKFAWTILVGIAIIILAYAMYKMLIVQPPTPQTVQTVAPVVKEATKQVAQTVSQNITRISII